MIVKKVFKPRDGHESWSNKRNDLTVGKIYDAYTDDKEIVYSSDGIYWEVTNDFGKKAYVHESHMVSLDDVRDNKLKDIGI